MRRVRVVFSLGLVRTDRVREAAAAALADPRLAASPEVAAMVADCAERAPRYLQHEGTFLWGCGCHQDAYVTDLAGAEAALAVFVAALREAEQAQPDDDGHLVTDPWPGR
jgi:hypothetical protein